LVSQSKNARLDIIGLCDSCTIKAVASANVIVHGRLHDIASFYENARVFIAPTRFAAGIPHKAHESAAHGLPTVSSPIIASQLGWEDIILSGGSSQEFSRYCVTLHESPDLWSLQQASILKQVEDDCSPEIFHKTVTALFN
jgi:glycosyltransferase involved in cell wall biosynthesis